MALGVPMLIMVYDNPVSNYFMRTGIVFMKDFGVMCLIFVPKFVLVYYGTEEDLAGSTSTSAGKTQTGSGDDSAAAHQQEVEQLQAKVKVLEDELAAKS